MAVDEHFYRTLCTASAGERDVLCSRKSEVDTIFSFGNTVVGSFLYVLRELKTLAFVPTVNGVSIRRNAVEDDFLVVCFHRSERNVGDGIGVGLAVNAGYNQVTIYQFIARFTVCIPESSADKCRLCFRSQVRYIDVVIQNESVHTVTESSAKKCLLCRCLNDGDGIFHFSSAILCGNGDGEDVSIDGDDGRLCVGVSGGSTNSRSIRISSAVRLGDRVLQYSSVKRRGEGVSANG